MRVRYAIRGIIPTLALVAAFQPAAAQSVDKHPDPATIVLPDVTPISDPQLRDDGLKFFYFHKAGVSFDDAYADLAFCRRYLVTGPALVLPGFEPWVEAGSRKSEPAGVPQYGLVGAVIGELIAGPLERSRRNTIMRRCMEPRGYARYPLRRDSWHAIVDGDAEQALLKQARLASGTAPADQALTE